MANIITRRSLVTGASTALAAQAPAAPLRIAFLGLQHSHAEGKVQMVRSIDRYRLAGVWDDSPDVRAKYQSAGLAVLDPDKMLGDATIAVVAVESDVIHHYRHALLALNAGKHVHLEKPPAGSLAEFRNLQETASRRGLLVQLGYMWRHNPAIQGAIEAVQKGWLGDIFQFRAIHNTLAGADLRRVFAQFPGGQMFEQGSHLIDVAVRALGRPERVTPFLRRTGAFPDGLQDNTAAVLEWKRATGVVLACTLQPNAKPYRTVEFYGSNGVASVTPIEPPGLIIDLEKPAGPYRAGRQQVPVPAYRRYEADFLALERCIRTAVSLSVTPAEDLAIEETLLRASAMQTAPHGEWSMTTKLTLATCLTLAILPLLGQETRGTIAGRVVDPSGAVIPGAQVVAVHLATNTKTSATANEQGNYLITYRLLRQMLGDPNGHRCRMGVPARDGAQRKAAAAAGAHRRAVEGAHQSSHLVFASLRCARRRWPPGCGHRPEKSSPNKRVTARPTGVH